MKPCAPDLDPEREELMSYRNDVEIVRYAINSFGDGDDYAWDAFNRILEEKEMFERDWKAMVQYCDSLRKELDERNS